VFTLGVRLPTGRGAVDAAGALLENMTGRGRPALIAGAQLERTTDRWPFAISMLTQMEVGETSLLPSLTSSVSLGRTLGSRWTVNVQLRSTVSWAVDGPPAYRTTAGFRVIHGKIQRWRIWAGAEADLGAPYLGRHNDTGVSIGVGVTCVLR